MDVAKFLRLQGAIQAAMDSVPSGQAVVGAAAMEHAYLRLRAEVASAIPETDLGEFDRLHPTGIPGHGRDPLEQAARYSEARAVLASMGGWLGGYVQAAKMQMEVDAYAQARVKEERSVGFKGSSA